VNQLIGKTIAHYKILERLGGGGMGMVYKAQDLKLDRFVALKFLLPYFSDDEEGRKRFIQEAKAASALDHPNICSIFEIGETEDEQIFIVMAYYEGETLKQKIQRGPMQVDEALDIVIQIVEGLVKAHEKDIVHRDIKPANIMITPDGVAKILDFGLAKLSDQTVLTKEGTTLGTVAYMSPEQVRGGMVDKQSDIWSFGIILYETITGISPFKGEYEQATMYSILNEEPEQVSKLCANLPKALTQIVHHSLQKSPEARYGSCADLLNDLKSLKKEQETGIIGEYSAKKSISRVRLPFLHIAIVVSLILLMVGILFYFWQSTEIREKSLEHSFLNKKNRLAVLPLANLSQDKEDEYFVDGMTEELISTLSKINGLRVIARTSVMQYKETTESIAEIGEELGVSNILEGSVRKADNKLRITLQLIDTQTQEHRWAQDYDRELKDIFRIQSNVAQRVAEALRMELLLEERIQLERRSTDNIEAYKSYLRGRDQLRYYTQSSMRQALTFFNEAIEIDSDYAKAYAGLADCYYNLSSLYIPPDEAMPNALSAAEKALEINSSLADAHATIGAVKAFYYWDWVAGEKEFKKAIRLNPSYTTALHYYGIYLTVHGRFKEAIAELNQAHQLDPLSRSIEMTSIMPYYYGRQFEQTIKKCLKLIETEPDFYAARGLLGRSYLQIGEISKAIRNFEQEAKLNPSQSGYLGNAYAIAGKTNEARKLLDDMIKRREKGEYIRPDLIAVIFVGLGDKDQAFKWLEEAYHERIEELILINVDPIYDSIRSDERFIALLKNMGLK
jgi:serine/threonine protein kinase/Tfp pilus assembly protein PilF